MKNRIIAAFLAFFLGGFGLHKFYLGQIGWGVLYLVFCWTFIPGIVAFFESIGFLITSDESFNRQFNYDALPPVAAMPPQITNVIHVHNAMPGSTSTSTVNLSQLPNLDQLLGQRTPAHVVANRLFEEGRHAYESKQYELAESKFATALLSKPEDDAIRIWHATALWALSKTEQAIAELSQVEHHAQDPEVRNHAQQMVHRLIEAERAPGAS
jgi:TM2 domain-containing membrane protein YozV/thioredoxin-like negative regulator of GroEL